MKTILLLCLLLSGCGFHDNEIKPDFVQYMPAPETLECETDALMHARTITTSKGHSVERRFVNASMVAEVCGTDAGRSTTACTKTFTYSKAGSNDPAQQFWVIYVPWGTDDYMRNLMRHELRHVYAGEYHD